MFSALIPSEKLAVPFEPEEGPLSELLLDAAGRRRPCQASTPAVRRVTRDTAIRRIGRPSRRSWTSGPGSMCSLDRPQGVELPAGPLWRASAGRGSAAEVGGAARRHPTPTGPQQSRDHVDPPSRHRQRRDHRRRPCPPARLWSRSAPGCSSEDDRGCVSRKDGMCRAGGPGVAGTSSAQARKMRAGS
jgi:hypothetical protein